MYLQGKDTWCNIEICADLHFMQFFTFLEAKSGLLKSIFLVFSVFSSYIFLLVHW